MRLLARYVACALAAVGAVALAGCSSPASLGEEYARNSIDNLLAPTVFHSHAYDIVPFAEHVQAATEDSGIVMLGVDEADDADSEAADEAIGWITLGLIAPDTRAPQGYWDSPSEQDPGPYCFRVGFNHWGVDDVRGVDCPDELVAVPAPPSQRPRVAVNAEEAVRSVLTALPDDLRPEADVVAAVTVLLEPHPNGVTPLAEVTASIEGRVVAVATGDDDDCVLVLRTGTGEVDDVHVPSIYLNRGELGCRASTAFADLRPPH
ncbi:hypothetical protein [Ruania zhangjianzhongii]|uniref:hypothetical protein n=1 Tax=Ruania zhangjianzhongii TaxID=2603206 RepID=UPI0011CBB5E5|nr:hypothetical protein [Ruania zhangjianzhongii]